MTYRDWVREGEQALRAMPEPTPEEHAAIEAMLGQDATAQAAAEEADEPTEADLRAWDLEHNPSLDDLVDGILGGVYLNPDRNG